MGILNNKKFLITGITNEKSIAFGIAKAMYAQNAKLAFSYKNERLKNKLIQYAKMFNSNIVIPCNVVNTTSIIQLFNKLSKHWKTFDGFIHSIAFTPSKQLDGNYIKLINKKTFRITHEITSYSFVDMVKMCQHMLNKNSSILTISYIGSNKVVPNYNIMGVAKSSLESNMRYMAYALGNKKIRVNALSIGPTRTESASIIKNFNSIIKNAHKKRLIKKNITTLEIGNVAAFLCSNLSSAISGQVIYADGGASIVE